MNNSSHRGYTPTAGPLYYPGPTTPIHSSQTPAISPQIASHPKGSNYHASGHPSRHVLSPSSSSHASYTHPAHSQPGPQPYPSRVDYFPQCQCPQCVANRHSALHQTGHGLPRDGSRRSTRDLVETMGTASSQVLTRFSNGIDNATDAIDNLRQTINGLSNDIKDLQERFRYRESILMRMMEDNQRCCKETSMATLGAFRRIELKINSAQETEESNHKHIEQALASMESRIEQRLKSLVPFATHSSQQTQWQWQRTSTSRKRGADVHDEYDEAEADIKVAAETHLAKRHSARPSVDSREAIDNASSYSLEFVSQQHPSGNPSTHSDVSSSIRFPENLARGGDQADTEDAASPEGHLGTSPPLEAHAEEEYDDYGEEFSLEDNDADDEEEEIVDASVSSESTGEPPAPQSGSTLRHSLRLRRHGPQ